MSTETVRRTIPTVVTFVVGIIMLAEYYLAAPGIIPVATTLRTWAVIIFELTVLFGVISLLRSHMLQVTKRASGSQAFYSAWVIVVFMIFLVLGFALPKGVSNPDYIMMYNSIYMSSSAALWSLLGFFCTLSAYRAFRARNRYAGVLLITGFLVLLGIAPWGEIIWPGFVPIREWIQGIIFTAGTRALVLTFGIGGIYFAIRTLLGYEKGYMGK